MQAGRSLLRGCLLCDLVCFQNVARLPYVQFARLWVLLSSLKIDEDKAAVSACHARPVQRCVYMTHTDGVVVQVDQLGGGLLEGGPGGGEQETFTVGEAIDHIGVP